MAQMQSQLEHERRQRELLEQKMMDGGSSMGASAAPTGAGGAGEAGRPLLLALALSDDGRDSSTFQAVVNLVLELRVW